MKFKTGDTAYLTETIRAQNRAFNVGDAVTITSTHDEFQVKVSVPGVKEFYADPSHLTLTPPSTNPIPAVRPQVPNADNSPLYTLDLSNRDFIVMTAYGWGRGKTIKEAKENARKEVPADRRNLKQYKLVYTAVFADASTTVNDDGLSYHTDHRQPIRLGEV